MAGRKTPETYRVDSVKVQGEGSFVDLKYITYGERHLTSVDVKDLLTSHVVAWDWVNSEGAELPQPPEGLDDLVQPEIDFLIESLFSVPKEESKN